MLSRRFRRSSQRRVLTFGVWLLLALLLLDTLTILKHYREFSQNLASHTYDDVSELPTPVRGQKIFIVAQFWTNAQIIHSRWGAALLNLVSVLGASNVYVSIYESGSLDNTKEILTYLDTLLTQNNIAHTITLDPSTHADEINVGPYDSAGNPRPGWVLPPHSNSGKEIRRIPYLARTHNLSLQPLFKEQTRGTSYDRILFLNDVVFTPRDVLTLLSTNSGSYSAACALDFHYPARLATYYDTFALRDSNGYPTLSAQFPYFRPSLSLTSFLRGLPSRVSSCWNGIVVYDAAPFYPSSKPTASQSTFPSSPLSDAAQAITPGLPFRSIPDSLASSHTEASECCLINADLTTSGHNNHGIYINPAVRVGYTELAYNQTHFGESETFISARQYVMAMWLHRLNRVRTESAEKGMRVVRRRLETWKGEVEMGLTREKREEYGEMCLVDEMHLLIWNGWKHA